MQRGARLTERELSARSETCALQAGTCARGRPAGVCTYVLYDDLISSRSGTHTLQSISPHPSHHPAQPPLQKRVSITEIWAGSVSREVHSRCKPSGPVARGALIVPCALCTGDKPGLTVAPSAPHLRRLPGTLDAEHAPKTSARGALATTSGHKRTARQNTAVPTSAKRRRGGGLSTNRARS